MSDTTLETAPLNRAPEQSFEEAPWERYPASPEGSLRRPEGGFGGQAAGTSAPWERYPASPEGYAGASKAPIEERRRGRAETWRRIRESFSGDDPLLFAPEEKRGELAEIVAVMENPDEERKKLALAAYYSGLNDQDFAFVYNNIEQACELANGEKTSIDRAYAGIREYLRGGRELPANLEAYKQSLELYEKNHQGFWTGVWGAASNLYWGQLAYLSKIAGWIAWDVLGDNGRAYDAQAIERAKPELDRIYGRRTADMESARYKAYGIEKPPVRDLLLSKPNRLGVYHPPDLNYEVRAFGDPQAEEENRRRDAAYIEALRKYPDRYGYVPAGAKTYSDVQKAFWAEVDRRYAEQHGESAAEEARTGLRAQEHAISGRTVLDANAVHNGMLGSRYVKERIQIFKDVFEEKLQENRALYHPGNIETDDLATLVKNGEYGKTLGKGLALVYDQLAESILPMAVTAYATGTGSRVKGITLRSGARTAGTLAKAGGAAVNTGSFAAAMKAEGEQNIFELKPDATPEEINAYSTRHALYEVLPEYIFGWFPLFNKLAAGGSRKFYKSFWGGVADYGLEFAKSGAKDSFGEFLTFTAEKIDDAFYGFGTPGGKSLSELSREEFHSYYMDGFPEMLVGAFFSAGPGGALGHIPRRGAALELNKATERAAGIIESRVEELSGKETLTDGEKAELEGLTVALASGDMRGTLDAAQKLAVAEMIHTQDKYTADEFSDEYSDVDEEAEAKARIAAPVEQMRERVPHDPADTAAEVERLRVEYDSDIAVTESWTKADLRPLMDRVMEKYALTEDEAYDYCSKRAGALWVDGRIVLNARNVRPHEVAFKLLHEIGLHEGIRKAYGEQAANQLFDLVWKECRDHELMRGILRDYAFLEQETRDGNGVFDEDGNPVYRELSLEEQREAAEEFLAHLQETNGVPLSEIYQDNRSEIDAWGRENGYDTRDLTQKEELTRHWMSATGFRPERPGWLKRLLAQIRLWLNRHGVLVHHLSDDDIQAILAQSAMAARRSKFKGRGVRYSVNNAIPSKAGFAVERVNGNAGREFNDTKGVIVQPEQIYRRSEVPEEQVQKWLRERCLEYARTRHILGEHETPALGDGVKVSVGSVKAVLNHPGSDIKNNLIAAIPDMLKDAVLIQTENNGNNRTHLLASKVRYGEDERLIVGMVIHENQGKFYYDHELVEIKDAEFQSSLPGTTGVGSESASVLTIIQNALFASGFDKKDNRNTRFSVSPVWTGSAADYETPSLQYIGTGEGAQVYGWGLYGSASEKVARWYANEDAERKRIKIPAKVLLDGEVYDFDSEIPDFNVWSSLQDVRAEGGVSEAIKHYRDLINRKDVDESLKELYGNLAEWLEKNRARIQYIPMQNGPPGKRNLYEQTFFAGKEENLLDWNKPVTEDQQKKIAEQLREEGLLLDGDPDQASADYRELKRRRNEGEDIPGENFDAAYDRASRLHAQRNVIGKTIDGHIPSGSMVYENLEEILGEPRAVSEFLYRAGIDGVTYIGDSSGVRNYVAFSDQDIRVDRHIRFSLAVLSDPESGNVFPLRTESSYQPVHRVLREMQGKTFRNADTGIEAKLSNTGVNKLLSNKARAKSIANGYTDAQHLQAAANVDRLFENGVLLEDRADRNNDPNIASIKRFAAPFYTAGDFAEALITLKESVQNGARIYSLELNEIRKPSSPDKWGLENQANTQALDGYYKLHQKIEKARALIDKEQKNVVFPASGGNPDIRYSAGLVGKDARTKNLIAMMCPIVGGVLEHDGAYYAKRMRDQYGVHLDDVEARIIAVEAIEENREAARRRGFAIRNKWLYENTPLYRDIVDFAGHEFRIKPSYRFTGEKFSGTWISPEYRQYSEKRPQGKNETDASYKRYLARREKALQNASGYASDELAEAIGRKQGRDPLEVEQEIIDFFRTLTKPEFYHRYTEWKQDEAYADKEEARRGKEEWMKSEQARIEEEVVKLLQRGLPITAEWIRENRAVYRELYRLLFHDRKVPDAPGKKDLEAINAALTQESANASVYAEAYRSAREKAYGEYLKKLGEFRERVMKSKADAVKLQREALDFAEKNLPSENRGEFARKIVSLLEYTPNPGKGYPEGRRLHEFRELFRKITDRAEEVRKTNGSAAIREMLNAVRIKRNYKGIPTSVLPAEQWRIDRIRRAVDMDRPTLLNAIEYNNEKIMELETLDGDELQRERYLEDNQILETFGDLDSRSADETEAAERMLKEIIVGGRSEFRVRLELRKTEVEDMCKRAVADATFGRNSYKDRGDAKNHSKFMLDNMSLGTLMRVASGKSIQDFDYSIGGRLYQEVEESTQEEQTRLRHLQEDFDKALREIAGITGNRMETMRKKGKFFRMITEVEEHTGVFKMEYTRAIYLGGSKDDPVYEHGRRALHKELLPVEDYEDDGKMLPGARSILRTVDNGGEAIWGDRKLDDVAIAFLRQQLSDYDAGIRRAYEIFNDRSDDANYIRIQEEEEVATLLVLMPRTEDEARRVEVSLSQGAALQILLTWEQEHYQPNMKWNGWTEESIEQLKKFIKPEVLKMGYWMREAIAKNRKALDEKVYERYGAHLPLNEKYFPAAFTGSGTGMDGGLDRNSGGMSINPNFLIARKFHLKPVDTNADAFTKFFSNQIEQSHFLAWSDTIRNLRAVYGNIPVRNAISDNFGRDVSNAIAERVKTIAHGGNSDHASRLLMKLYRHWVPAKIAINPSSIIKQMLGTTAYMNHVPVKDFVTYFAKANFSNPDYRAFVAWAKNTDYMKNRLAGGLDKDLSYLLNYTRDSKAYSPLSDALLNWGTYGTRWADAWSALHGGYAAYMYALDQARAAGLPDVDAREAARRAWMRATDETQQSGYLKDQNYFQSNQGAYRYLTAFMSNPIQTMNLQLQTLHELRYGADKKAALKKLGRQILVNHLIVPTLMLFTTDMLRHGFNLADWWDEVEFEDYLLAWMLGSFESLFLVGKITGNIGSFLLDLLNERKASWQSISALPLIDDAARDVRVLDKILFGDDALTEKDLLNGVRAIGDFGMLAGTADHRAGAAGAVLHAIGTQGRRILNWFDDDKR